MTEHNRPLHSRILCDRCKSRAKWRLINPRKETVLHLCNVCRPMVIATIDMATKQDTTKERGWLWVALASAAALACSAPCSSITYDEATTRLGDALAGCGATETEQSVFAHSLLAVASCKPSTKVCAADVEACAARVRAAKCSTSLTCSIGCAP